MGRGATEVGRGATEVEGVAGEKNLRLVWLTPSAKTGRRVAPWPLSPRGGRGHLLAAPPRPSLEERTLASLGLLPARKPPGAAEALPHSPQHPVCAVGARKGLQSDSAGPAVAGGSPLPLPRGKQSAAKILFPLIPEASLHFVPSWLQRRPGALGSSPCFYSCGRHACVDGWRWPGRQGRAVSARRTLCSAEHSSQGQAHLGLLWDFVFPPGDGVGQTTHMQVSFTSRPLRPASCCGRCAQSHRGGSPLGGSLHPLLLGQHPQETVGAGSSLSTHRGCLLLMHLPGGGGAIFRFVHKGEPII